MEKTEQQKIRFCIWNNMMPGQKTETTMCLYKSRFDIKKKDDSQKVRESVYYIRLYGIRKELHAAYNICNRIHFTGFILVGEDSHFYKW